MAWTAGREEDGRALAPVRNDVFQIYPFNDYTVTACSPKQSIWSSESVIYLVAAPVLDRFVYGVASRDALATVSILLIFFLSALAASAVPAWRALRMDPMQALRAE